MSRTDVWLSVLWQQWDRSWSALERRICWAPDPGPRLAALRRLRTRLGGMHHPDPLRLLPSPPSLSDAEDAVAWLVAPRERPRPAPPDPALAGVETSSLVARLASTSPSMPRREMEELLGRGPVVVPHLIVALRDARTRGAAAAAVWIVVLLGELRHPDTVELLGACLRDGAAEVGIVAAEALAKLGDAAVPLLLARAAHGRPAERLLAYGALGLVPTDAAHQALLAALVHDPVLADVIAAALASHGRRDALAPLRACVASVPSRVRPFVAQAIATLESGGATPDPLADWRLRYRPLPRLGWRCPPGPLAVARHVHRRGWGSAAGRAVATDTPASANRPRCTRCGGSIWRPAGLPVCRHTAGAVVALQRTIVGRCLAAGLGDVWAALDACDAADWRLVAGAPRSTGAGRAARTLALGRGTLYWLAGGGRTDLRTASAHLTLLAGDVARLYAHGAPRDVTVPAAHPQKYS